MTDAVRAVLICGLLLLLFSAPAIAEQSVNAVGRADIIGNNRDGARTNALTNAFREAVEKGIGVWVQSQTEVSDSALVRDQILTRAQGYVTNHEIIKEKIEDNVLVVTIKAEVAVDKIGTDIKTLVGRISTALGYPSITFVLTTWEKRGQQGSSSRTDNADISIHTDSKIKYAVDDDANRTESASASVHAREKSALNTSASSREQATVTAHGQSSQKSTSSTNGRIAADGQYMEGNGYGAGHMGYAATGRQSTRESGSISASGKNTYSGAAKVKASEAYASDIRTTSSESSRSRARGNNEATIAVDKKVKTEQNNSYSKIDEDIWVKYSESSIIDSFNQEFKEKGFKVTAADKARDIALATSIKGTSVNPFDRTAVRLAAEKEGVNFVARGEAKMLDSMISESTGNIEVTSEVGVEIIDVASGEIVAAYRNTATAASSRPMEAKSQSIKKAAVIAARILANQTIETWQNASLNGREFTIEFRNIKSKRSQERPILNVLESLGSITSSTNPETSILLVKLQFKGQKKRLEDGILDQLGPKPGFSEKEFDGPNTVDGKIVFAFK